MGDDNYIKYRGKCKEYCDQAVAADPTLTLVRGFYTCPIWRVREAHWWTVRPDGSIHDPTALQFPSAGNGFYEEFDGYIECDECGERVKEDDAQIADNGRYAFCSGECYGRFVGL